MHHHTDTISHTTAFVIPVVELDSSEKYLNRSTMSDRSDDPSHKERTLYLLPMLLIKA